MDLAAIALRTPLFTGADLQVASSLNFSLVSYKQFKALICSAEIAQSFLQSVFHELARSFALIDSSSLHLNILSVTALADKLNHSLARTLFLSLRMCVEKRRWQP